MSAGTVSAFDFADQLAALLDRIGTHCLPRAVEAVRQTEAGEFNLAHRVMDDGAMIHAAADAAYDTLLVDAHAQTRRDVLDDLWFVLGALTGVHDVDYALDEHDPVRAALRLLEAGDAGIVE